MAILIQKALFGQVKPILAKANKIGTNFSVMFFVIFIDSTQDSSTIVVWNIQDAKDVFLRFSQKGLMF